MADDRGNEKTTPIQPRLPAKAHEHLRALVKTGLYGTTPTEVAKNLILDQLKILVRDGTIPKGD